MEPLKNREYKSGVFYLHSKTGCRECEAYKQRIKHYTHVWKELEWEEIMYEDSTQAAPVIGELSKNKGFNGFPFVTIYYVDRHHKIMPSEIPYWARRVGKIKYDNKLTVSVKVEGSNLENVEE